MLNKFGNKLNETESRYIWNKYANNGSMKITSSSEVYNT